MNPLAQVVKPGDWLIYYPKDKKNLLSRMIMGATYGPVIHASMVATSDTVFETNGDMFRAAFTPLANAESRHVLVVRRVGVEGQEKKMMALMKAYEGLPYGYWDIAMHGLFCWLAAPLRKKVVEFLTTKKFMVCSERVARITYDLTGAKELRGYEGLTPEDLREIAYQNPNLYTIVADYNGQK